MFRISPFSMALMKSVSEGNPHFSRFLAGRAHELAAHDFSCRSTNQAIDMLDAKLQAIVDDEQKFLSKSFMMSIFQEMRDKITPFI